MTYFVDHVESTLKHSIKDLRDLTSDVSPQLVDDGRHGAEDLGLSGGGDVALVVNQDRVEKRWHKVLPYLEWHQKYSELLIFCSTLTELHSIASLQKQDENCCSVQVFNDVLHIIGYSKTSVYEIIAQRLTCKLPFLLMFILQMDSSPSGGRLSG